MKLSIGKFVLSVIFAVCATGLSLPSARANAATSMIDGATSTLPSTETVDCHQSGLSGESAQIHELWRSVIERSSTMRAVRQKLITHRLNKRSELQYLKMLDRLLDSVERGDPEIVMGSPNAESESAYRLARDQAKTLLQTYREYFTLSENMKEQPVKNKSVDSNEATKQCDLNSTRERLLKLVGEQALCRLDSELQKQREQ